MEGFESEGGIQETTMANNLKQFGDNSTEGAVFDASQYAFFGKDLVEEVELGGLEDEEEELPAVEFNEEEFLLGGQEAEVVRSISDVDDLASTFSKLNKIVSESRTAGVIDGRGSRESSSTAEWVQGEDFPNWYDQQELFDPEGIQDGKRWSSQPFSFAHISELKNLYRTSSYLEQQQHQHFSSEPIIVPKSSYTSYPPPRGQSPQASPNNSHLNSLYLGSGPQMAISLPNLSPFSSSQL